jgi:hypothetical protein
MKPTSAPTSTKTVTRWLRTDLGKMKSPFALAAVKTVIHWLRWTAVVALVYAAWGNLAYFALGRQVLSLQPAPLATVGNLVFMLDFHTLSKAAFVVAGAMIAPRARLATAIVLAAVQVPLSLWNHVLSRVSLVELVLLQGGANYGQFALEALGPVLGVVYIFWSAKAKGSVPSVPPSQLSLSVPPPGSADSKPALTAAKTVIRWLRWTGVAVLVYSALGGLIYSALGREGWAVRPAPLPVVQELGGIVYFHTLSYAAFVAAGAIIAPRARLAIAIVLAAALVPSSFWGHVLVPGGPWWFWTINYTHFTLEALGALLGVIFIFRSEKVHVP